MMNRREKSIREESNKSRRNPNNEPSFSSILLDEILRSTDTNAEKTGGLKFFTEIPVNRQLNFSARTDQRSHSREHEEVGSFGRTYLVEKWRKEEQYNGKISAGKKHPYTPRFEKKSSRDNDLLFFSSTSCSSDSSGALSAADPDLFVSTKNTRVPYSSSVAKPPKHVKICAKSKQEERLSYNDQKNKKEVQNLIKPKSTASKIYTNFMTMKQPVSPGGKLTSFINSLFNNTNRKESRTNEGFRFQDSKKSSNASYSTRSSASSFSRSSSVVENSPKSIEKTRNGIQRRVGFDPASVILDEDLRLCGHKNSANENFGRSPLEKNGAHNDLKGYQNQRKVDFPMFGKHWEEDDKNDNYDGISDSSSDLFELDHLSMYTNNRFCGGVRNDLF
ncbi:protein BIG GRAIN 1-like A [Primulina huaijiensis]|uniref:protein BIG GRAIN 1-like A n=1 Tax=Primulina huaijiensis TaxID=1492673 RepID=UPI003CC6FB3F